MFLNPFNWGKKQEPTEEQINAAIAKRAEEAELEAKAERNARSEGSHKSVRDLERQLQNQTKRIEETMKKLDLLESKKSEEMRLMAEADKAGSEARKKAHWRKKKRLEEEIKSLMTHMNQLEDMKATCEKRITQLQRQEDLTLATEALSKTKVDVEEVENVMEEAKMGVENVADVEAVINSYQLSDEVYDDDEMEKELAEYEAAQKKKEDAEHMLKPGEVAKLTAPQVPDTVPAAEVEAAALKKIEREMAQ